MNHISDDELINELKCRFEENKRAFHDVQKMTHELEQVNKKLQQSETLKSDFLSNIKNEINNPLNSIMGLAEMIFSQKNEQRRDFSAVAQMIYEESFQLDFQLQNIFAAAELEAGEAVPCISRVDIHELVQRLMDRHKHEISPKQLTIQLTEHGTDVTASFNTDAGKLQCALTNLLKNAIEYSNDRGNLEIAVWLEGGALTISVADHGIGIAECYHQIIFDRFVQLDQGTTKKHRGQGLGLSVTKAIVELLGGKITLLSAPGHGTTMILFIPEGQISPDLGCYALEGNELMFDEGEQVL
jgi:signal transduction histidine kinase